MDHSTVSSSHVLLQSKHEFGYKDSLAVIGQFFLSHDNRGSPIIYVEVWTKPYLYGENITRHAADTANDLDRYAVYLNKRANVFIAVSCAKNWLFD